MPALTRRLSVVSIALTVALSGCFVVNDPVPPAGPAPPTIALEIVTTGLSKPWDIAFTSQGVTFLTERGGDISALVDRKKRVMHHPGDVRVNSEGGMLGLTVDPQFHNGMPYLYTCFASTLGAGGGAAADVRVVRWRFGFTGLTDRTDIVTGMPYSSGRHSGCRPRFGPDGNLWITTGDAAIGTTPQDLTSLGGKVLRVDRDGAPAAGNPDLTALDASARGEIYTYGHRNPQGIAFRPNTNVAYSVEHGPGTDDEVNRLEKGMNAGWDPVPLPYNESVPMTDFSLPGTVVGPVWASGSPTIAPSGADFLRWAKWEGWSGALVVAVLKGRQLRVLFLNGAGNVTAQTTLLTELGRRIRSVVHNPTNGDVYITTDDGGGDGQIWRLTTV